MSPAREQLDGALRDHLFGQEALEQAAPEKAHQLLSIDPGDWIEGAVLRDRAVSDQAVEVWLEVNLVAVGLDRDDTAGHGLLVGSRPAEEIPERLVEALAEESKELAVVLETDPEHLADGNDVLAVRHASENLLDDALGKGNDSLLVA